jgi:predicted NUDIX family phosphoesterase
MQLIPYVTLTHEDKIFHYTRGGGEARLDNKVSIGLGGHVVVEDVHVVNSEIDLTNTLLEAAIRESLEEVGFPVEVGNPVLDKAFMENSQIRGLILDRNTPVGRVHLGVHIPLTLSEKIEIASKEIGPHSGWSTKADLEWMGHKEMWSNLCLHYV